MAVRMTGRGEGRPTSPDRAPHFTHRARQTRRAMASRLALLWLGALAPAAHAASPLPDPAVVQTDAGAVRGTATPTHRAFLGIPYARPPVGALRWKPPQPADPWQGERDATRFASACAQPRSYVSWTVGPGSEDCLYLNVYTPAGQHANLPVIFWIHGGASTIGSASEYPAASLAEVGRVVVVTINYRLGVFGYLALPSIAAEDARINYGIRDQQQALRWVQRNIARFGGDPTRVTLAGESAGGGGVSIHLTSPLAKGLAHRAILQSAAATGLMNTPIPLPVYQQQGETFASAAGCPAGPGQPDCLRARSTQDILAATPYSEDFRKPAGLWGPIPDGELIPAPVFERYKAGDFARVPVLMGVTRNEFRLLGALAFEAPLGRPPTEEEYQSGVAALTGAQSAGLLTSFYPSKAHGSPSAALGQLLSDFLAICPSHRTSKTLSRWTRLYAYRFDDPRAPSILEDASLQLGAYHAGELQYLFDQPTTARLDAPQRALAWQMKRYWANFAATGDPNRSEQGDDKALPHWPRFEPVAMAYRKLVPDGLPGVLSFGALPLQHKCLLWDSLDALIANAPAPAPATSSAAP